MKNLSSTLLILLCNTPATGTADTWQLADALKAPYWLQLSGESRIRYESLDGQFRRTLSGSDQVIAFRSLLHAQARTAIGSFGIELHDARAYRNDDGSFVSSSVVNTFDVIQAYYQRRWIHNDKALQQSRLKIGRFTMDIGSRRFVERNDFRNTINAFSGAHWQAQFTGDIQLDAFYTVPVQKLPRSRDKLLDNDFDLDEEASKRRWWGVHLQFPEFVGDTQLDLFGYGLKEADTSELPTFDRQLIAPGFRLFRSPDAGAWDMDIEAAWRFGSRSSTLTGTEKGDLRVDAYMLHAEFGYTFANSWNLRLALEWDVASGDKEPDDDKFERYERLFGTRRRDLGNTGIFGPLTRSNLSAPAVRVSFRRQRWDGRAYMQWPSLHEKKDAWLVAALRDPEGNSGTRLGTNFDSRLRYWLVPDNLRAELGASAMWYREFANKVNAGPEDNVAIYGYFQVTAYF